MSLMGEPRAMHGAIDACDGGRDVAMNQHGHATIITRQALYKERNAAKRPRCEATGEGKEQTGLTLRVARSAQLTNATAIKLAQHAECNTSIRSTNARTHSAPPEARSILMLSTTHIACSARRQHAHGHGGVIEAVLMRR